MSMDDGRTLVSPVIDHALVDGVAAIAALRTILDNEPEEKSQAQAPKRKRAEGPPMSLPRRIIAFLSGLKSVLCSPVLPADAMTILKVKDHRHPDPDKSCAMGERVLLEEMKEIKNKFPGATVNDIMLATLTLMLQSYFVEVGQEPTIIRGTFPVNMRAPTEDVVKNSVGNRVAPGNFVFPMFEADPVKMIWKIKEQIDMVKCSPGPLLHSKLFDFIIPKLVRGGKKKLLHKIVADSYGKVTVMLSNVPGPSDEVALCGQPIDDMMFYAFAPIGCYLGVISYNGIVSLGVVTARSGESDASRLAKHWSPAFRKLKLAVDAARASDLRPPRKFLDRLADWCVCSCG